MLRFVFCLHRRSAETWVEYLKRSALELDRLAGQHGLKEWVGEHRLRKWRFPGRLAQLDDERWSSAVIAWTPNGGSGRGRGRPKTRWATDFERYAGGIWFDLAKDKDLWDAAENLFAIARAS